MNRTFVVAIQLNLFWDTLLFYENACANTINSLQFFRRRNLPHSCGRCHSYPLEIKELTLYLALTLFHYRSSIKGPGEVKSLCRKLDTIRVATGARTIQTSRRQSRRKVSFL